ncbi:MAG: LysR family transcriptional regulator [Polynucleobacter sp.]|jgi:DNA-binding transcriptional LysR family regulator
MSILEQKSKVSAVIRSRFRLKHFEVFRNVCALHTIRKAAAASNMTQPAATKLIQELEDMFCVILFQRNRRGMQLTQQGEILHRHIDVIFSDIGNISEEINQFTHGGRGLMRLGILPSLSSTLLSRSINEFLERHPLTQFVIREGTTDELIGQLMRNEIDITFGRMLEATHISKLQITKIYTEAFDIVCGNNNPLALQKDIKWKDLSSCKWILPEAGSPLREIADGLFTARGNLRPMVSIASSSFHQMRYVIAMGQLLGVLPHSLAQKASDEGDVIILRPKQAAQVAPISLISRNDFEQSPIILTFKNIVLNAAISIGLD